MGSCQACGATYVTTHTRVPARKTNVEGKSWLRMAKSCWWKYSTTHDNDLCSPQGVYVRKSKGTVELLSREPERRVFPGPLSENAIIIGWSSCFDNWHCVSTHRSLGNLPRVLPYVTSTCTCTIDLIYHRRNEEPFWSWRFITDPVPISLKKSQAWDFKSKTTLRRKWSRYTQHHGSGLYNPSNHRSCCTKPIFSRLSYPCKCSQPQIDNSSSAKTKNLLRGGNISAVRWMHACFERYLVQQSNLLN